MTVSNIKVLILYMQYVMYLYVFDSAVYNIGNLPDWFHVTMAYVSV